MTKAAMTKALALTIGEPAGIGPDIAIAAWLQRRERDLPPFYLIGDSGFIATRARALGVSIGIADVSAGRAAAVFADALPVVKSGIAATAQPGQPDDSSAPAAIASSRGVFNCFCPKQPRSP